MKNLYQRSRGLLLAGGALLLALPLATASCLGDGGNGATNERTASPEQEALSSIKKLPSKSVCEAAAPGKARCHAVVRTTPNGEAQVFATPSGYGPSDLKAAYNLPSSGSTGTIAIVDAYDNPNAEADLGTYRSHFGLTPCTTANGCFKKVNQNQQASPLPSGNTGWGAEIALDLDMASAVCPSCKIILVEASSNSLNDLGAAVNAAAALGATVISNSWGGSEWSGESSFDSQYFNHPGVTITASTGDNGYGVEYPASSANVLAVGGTSLTKSTGTTRGWVEGAWAGAGSGCSAYTTKPSFQTDTGCKKRAVGDVSAVADPNTGVAVYDTYGGPGWQVYGGTSVAAPLVASILALTGQGKAGNSWPYAHTGAFYDVTSGSNGSCGSYLCTAGPGYDGPTGLGTPNASVIASGGDGGGTGGGGTCSHPICDTGQPLTSSRTVKPCDPCVARICANDTYCCNTAWDAICVGEVSSICGESCTGGGSSSSSSSGGGTSSSSSSSSGGGTSSSSSSSSSGGTSSSSSSSSSGGTSDPTQLCVDTINKYRATLGVAPLQRWTQEEACVNNQASEDATANVPHSAFGQCSEWAQDECPGWPGPEGTLITNCLAQMWAEGPPPAGQDNHWLNMSNAKYTKVACGWSVRPDRMNLGDAGLLPVIA